MRALLAALLLLAAAAAAAADPAPRLALVLSSGGARAFAHVGVIDELEKAGLRPDLVVGSSGGAIVGAIYARHGSATKLRELTRSTDWTVLFPHPVLARFGAGARSEELERLMRALLGGDRIERLPIGFAAVATDLQTGELAAFVSGDAAQAVRASAAAPGRFLPAEIKGRTYADGALASPLPVQAARALGADYVIAVDVTYPPRDAAPVNDFTDLLYQAFHIQAARITAWELERADLVIRPSIPPTTETYTDRDRAMLIAAGAKAAQALNGRLVELAHAWRGLREQTRLARGVR
jgi:NTE family protein